MNFYKSIEVLNLRIALLKSRAGADNANVVRKIERRKRALLAKAE